MLPKGRHDIMIGNMVIAKSDTINRMKIKEGKRLRTSSDLIVFILYSVKTKKNYSGNNYN